MGFLKASEHMDLSAGIGISAYQIFYLLINSVALGIILGLITYYKDEILCREQDGKTRPKLDMILDSSTIMFLCVGLCGILILVNNNLARAFAIGASLALVRFRVNLGKGSNGTNLFFGIIAGIACGLNELEVAWISTSIYLALQILLVVALYLMGLADRKKIIVEKKQTETVIAPTSLEKNSVV